MAERDPVREFERVRGILHGAAPELPPVDGVVKILQVLLLRGNDTEISRRGIEVRFTARESFQYFPELGPPAMQALLMRTTICPRGQALSFRLEDADLAALLQHEGPQRDRGPRWVWIVPGDDVVFLWVREARTSGPPPTEPAPLPEPARPKKLFAHLRQPFTCPHCERVAAVYRAAVDGWVCCGPRCGRSFTPPQRVRIGAELRENNGEVVRDHAPRSKIYR